MATARPHRTDGAAAPAGLESATTPAPRGGGRISGELVLCAGIAAGIVLLRAAVPLCFEQVFDSDQAIVGLMAKHLSEFRAFPLFFYGQNYMLGVQAWMAAPFFRVGGPTLAMLRAPLLLINVVVAVLLVREVARRGVRPVVRAGRSAALRGRNPARLDGADVRPRRQRRTVPVRPVPVGAEKPAGGLRRAGVLRHPSSRVHGLRAAGLRDCRVARVACVARRWSGAGGGLVRRGLDGRRRAEAARQHLRPGRRRSRHRLTAAAGRNRPEAAVVRVGTLPRTPRRPGDGGHPRDVRSRPDPAEPTRHQRAR